MKHNEKNIKLTIEYDGTNYHGWQSQENVLTVQGKIIEAIQSLTDKQCNLIGASRTDAGVHAYAQVANFITDSNIPADRFSYALNRILPNDIVIKRSEQVDMKFHSRFNAKAKKYIYMIYNSDFRSAIYKDKAYHVSKVLDICSMKKAMMNFLGTHDFAAFRATGSSTLSTIRTILGIDLTVENQFLKFEITGNGFLYNMVRIIVGTLIEVGTGKKHESEIAEVIESLDRRKAGKTAPAWGLYLYEIYY